MFEEIIENRSIISISIFEVLNEESKTNKGGNDLFGEYWNRVPLPTKAKTDSDGEIRISISSHRLKTDNATTQQTDGGKFFFFKVHSSTNMNTHIAYG